MAALGEVACFVVIISCIVAAVCVIAGVCEKKKKSKSPKIADTGMSLDEAMSLLHLKNFIALLESNPDGINPPAKESIGELKKHRDILEHRMLMDSIRGF